jgi:hypothetical protein
MQTCVWRGNAQPASPIQIRSAALLARFPAVNKRFRHGGHLSCPNVRDKALLVFRAALSGTREHWLAVSADKSGISERYIEPLVADKLDGVQ